MKTITTPNWQLNISAPDNIVEDAADIAQCIYVILATMKGTDPLRPTFGSDLFTYIDKPLNIVQPMMVYEIYTAISRWEPRVAITRVHITTEYLNARKIIHLECAVVRSSTQIAMTFDLWRPKEEPAPPIPEPPPPLTGTAIISNMSPRIGDVLTAAFEGEYTGKLTFSWFVDGLKVHEGETYTVIEEDIGFAITLEVTSDTEPGAVTSAPTAAVTPQPIAGAAIIDNMNPRIGDVLTGSFEGHSTGALTYAWFVNGALLTFSNSITLISPQLGAVIMLVINDSTGSVTSLPTAPVLKKAAPPSPTPPALVSATHDTVTLESVAGFEYSKDGATWTTENTFTDLTPETEYTFYQRIAETDDTEGSASSAGLSVTTDATVQPSIEWTVRQGAAVNNWMSVTHGNGLFVAVAGTGNGTSQIMTSENGTDWTLRQSPASRAWEGVAYGNGLFVAVARGGYADCVMTSENGIDWTLRQSVANVDWYSVCYGNGLFVAVSKQYSGNRVMTSSDGINWVLRQVPVDGQWGCVIYANGLFVIISVLNRYVLTSENGINWTLRQSAANNSWSAVAYGNGVFVAVAQSGEQRVMTSIDGINWTGRSGMFGNLKGIAYGAGLFCAVGSSSPVGSYAMTSENGIDWTLNQSAPENYWESITYGDGVFVAVAMYAKGDQVLTLSID